ncbi:MAG: hemerythrin domain-containing protein [Gammaproteobacteria bacterium]
MASPVEPPADLRRLGRSRVYTADDIPERLTQWHSPRVNRWERLCLTAGTLVIGRLGAAGTTGEELTPGAEYWLAPGMRWRVASLASGTRFELEIHAENRPAEISPKRLREAVLAQAVHATVTDSEDFVRLLDGLGAGERRLVRGLFHGQDAASTVEQAIKASHGRLFWHLLAAGEDGFAALVVRAAEPIGLADYLGRDHAVIEAALAGTLRGNNEALHWLRTTLGRHLAIEEELLFPAYVAAGGREAWVRGLKNEHRYLRQYLDALAEPDGRRKFLRLLDGHDEKEERVVYPDIIAHLGTTANDLLESVVTFPIPVTAG